jgi:hypothetical protein
MLGSIVLTTRLGVFHMSGGPRPEDDKPSPKKPDDGNLKKPLEEKKPILEDFLKQQKADDGVSRKATVLQLL